MSRKDPAEIVEIEVFDHKYPLRLRTPAERNHILQVAAEVDHRMREIARQSGTVDSLKVAILTALHMAEESSDSDPASKKLESAVRAGAKKWITAIDKEL